MNRFFSQKLILFVLFLTFLTLFCVGINSCFAQDESEQADAEPAVAEQAVVEQAADDAAPALGTDDRTLLSCPVGQVNCGGNCCPSSDCAAPIVDSLPVYA